MHSLGSEMAQGLIPAGAGSTGSRGIGAHHRPHSVADLSRAEIGDIARKGSPVGCAHFGLGGFYRAHTSSAGSGRHHEFACRYQSSGTVQSQCA